MYNLEPDEGSSYLYKIEGDSVVINQFHLSGTIFLRIEKENLPQEEIDKLKLKISEGSGNINVVILPPYVKVLKVSPVVRQTPSGKAQPCTRCGGFMRQMGGGGFICFQCGNEIAPPVRGGAVLDIGGMP